MGKSDKRAKVKGGRKPTQLEALQITKAFKEFQLYMLRAIYSNNMPKWLKNSVGFSCSQSINFCVECLAVIACSYNTKEKIEHIYLFAKGWNIVFHHIYILAELNGLSNHQRSVIFSLRVPVEEQLSAFLIWLKAEQKKELSQPMSDQNPKTTSEQ